MSTVRVASGWQWTGFWRSLGPQESAVHMSVVDCILETSQGWNVCGPKCHFCWSERLVRLSLGLKWRQTKRQAPAFPLVELWQRNISALNPWHNDNLAHWYLTWHMDTWHIVTWHIDLTRWHLTRGHLTHGFLIQGYLTQGYFSHGYLAQGYRTNGYLLQGLQG